MLRQKLSRLLKYLFQSQKAKVKGQKSGRELPEQTELEKITARVERLEGDLKKATGGYRAMLIKENPDILPELINGESIEGLDISLEVGKELTRKVRLQLENQKAADKVPAGAPARAPIDIESMSSDEKIAYGLSQRN
jgi:hypothetical protein